MNWIRQQINRRPWLSIVFDYKISFLLVLASIVAVFVLLPILSSIESLYQYYFNLKTGFVPDVQVRFNGRGTQEESRALITELEKRFHPAKVLLGIQRDIPAARLRNGSDVSIEQPLSIIGLDFQGDRTVRVRQGEKSVSCRLEQLQEFGSWVLDFSGCEQFADGPAYLGSGEEEIPVDLVAQGDFVQAYFDHQAHPEKTQSFYLFLENLINRFFRLKDTGLLFDRFVDYSQQKDIDFSVYKKRAILSYARLIFDTGAYSPPALLSRNIMKTISTYEVSSDITLEQGSDKIDLVALDAFAFEVEDHYPRNLLLLSLNRFNEYFSDSDARWIINLYFEGQGSLEEVRTFVHSRNPEVEVVLRSEAIPSFQYQLKTLVGGKLAMFSVLYFALLLILIVNMQKFYAIFNSQFFLLKVYGYNTPIFFWCTLLLCFVGAQLAYLILAVFYAMNNAALHYYYYPPIQMPLGEYLSLIGIGLAIPILCLLVEKFYNMKRIKA